MWIQWFYNGDIVGYNCGNSGRFEQKTYRRINHLQRPAKPNAMAIFNGIDADNPLEFWRFFPRNHMESCDGVGSVTGLQISGLKHRNFGDVNLDGWVFQGESAGTSAF